MDACARSLQDKSHVYVHVLADLLSRSTIAANKDVLPLPHAAGCLKYDSPHERSESNLLLVSSKDPRNTSSGRLLEQYRTVDSEISQYSMHISCLHFFRTCLIPLKYCTSRIAMGFRQILPVTSKPHQNVAPTEPTTETGPRAEKGARNPGDIHENSMKIL